MKDVEYMFIAFYSFGLIFASLFFIFALLSRPWDVLRKKYLPSDKKISISYTKFLYLNLATVSAGICMLSCIAVIVVFLLYFYPQTNPPNLSN